MKTRIRQLTEQEKRSLGEQQMIAEQKKQNELAELQAQENIILSKGLIPQILEKMRIEAWDRNGGKIPTTVLGNNQIDLGSLGLKVESHTL